MMTIPQAAILGANALGISYAGFDGSTAAVNDGLSMDSKLALTAWLGSYIRDNPDQFTAGQLATAQSMKGLSGAPLDDAGFSVGDFLEETVDNGVNLVGQPLVNLGNIASQTAMILPLVLLAAGAYILFARTRQIAAA